jgi:hypothetical protein
VSVQRKMFITDSQPHVVGHHVWSANSDFPTFTPSFPDFPELEYWGLGTYAETQLEFRRLLAMPSSTGFNNEWTRSKPRSHSKKTRHQRQPPLSQQETQRLNPGVSDDTSRAFPWRDAGFVSNFLVRLHGLSATPLCSHTNLWYLRTDDGGRCSHFRPETPRLT